MTDPETSDTALHLAASMKGTYVFFKSNLCVDCYSISTHSLCSSDRIDKDEE